MRRLFLLFLLLIVYFAQSQPLTVEKIMQDPKWIGTSPNNVFWSYDSKAIYFKWNPEKAISDSFYSYHLNANAPVKVPYNDGQLAQAINDGKYNKKHTQITYAYKGDIYWLDIPSDKTTRITQTADDETNPIFVANDESIVYLVNDDLYLHNIKTGFTRQLTGFKKGNPDKIKSITAEEQWLQREALGTSDVLQKRKDKNEQQKAYLNKLKDKDTLHIIYTGDNEVEMQQVSPDTRFITYVLFEEPADKKTIVPNYVTESGYTSTIKSREKVGVPLGKYSLYVFDRLKDTVEQIKTDSLPCIAQQPEYLNNYPRQKGDTSTTTRGIYLEKIAWNEDGSTAVMDIRSMDYKDRWLMQLDTATLLLKLVDHQHDEAWIAGPGIGWIGYEAVLDFVNPHTVYFLSEVSGYAHLYSFDLNTGTKKALTKGKYEVQKVQLSRDKKYFYLITNEEHPGKQNLYRINWDGSNKQQLTSMTGMYEVSLSPDEKNIAYRYSYQNKPWELYVGENTANRKPLQVTNKAMSDEWKAYPWRDTKIFTITARDGVPVYARIYEPAAVNKNNAAVIFVHGAGYLQNVDYGWSDAYYHEMMFNNLLSDKGYTVLDIDYRASAGYGRDWRTGIYRHMSGKDLNDEVDAARFLVQQYNIDSSRIGIYGGSYGGFMTLMAMFTQPTIFKAGAALRPVTDWAHYNHGYTAAILNEPYKDSIAYALSSPINFAGGLQNHLLICHGMVDVNVHFEDAVRLAQRLIELGKNNWELAVYPVESHGFVEPTSWTDEYKRILKLFDENLLK
jgi:dipeptidyl aminopeptidase/acylaminoacyl peptidase